jgi:hypothetical protein
MSEMKSLKTESVDVEGQLDGVKLCCSNTKRSLDELNARPQKRAKSESGSVKSMLTDRTFVSWVIQEFRLLPTYLEGSELGLWSHDDASGKWSIMSNLDLTTWLNSISKTSKNLAIFAKFEGVNLECLPVDILKGLVVRHMYEEYRAHLVTS